MSSTELQPQFSSLRPRSQERSSASPGAASFSQQNSRPSSSTFFHTAPVPSTPPPPFSDTPDEYSSFRSRNASQPRNTGGATAQNLLNLLNFGGPQNNTTSSSQAAPAAASISSTPAVPLPQRQSASTALSASDLVARYMSPTLPISQSEQRVNTATAQFDSSNTQNPLIALLNKQANAVLAAGLDRAMHEEDVHDAEAPIQSIEDSEGNASVKVEEQDEAPVRVFGTTASRGHTPFEGPKSASPMPPDHQPIFTYKNPFEALNESRNNTPNVLNSAPSQISSSAPFDNQHTARMASPSAISTRKMLTPKPRSQRSTISAPLESASKDIVEELSPSDGASREKEQLQPKVETVADHEVTQDGLRARTPEVLRAQEDDVQDTPGVQDPNPAASPRQQDDSGEWEDAESPEGDIAPREVPVYNFPIKAFVSIKLQLDTKSNIGIREDSIMEISRLKKEFDQLDRSLAAATTKYITYAFVKNGGMRIIRQDDGSDRHVFKNSHDRIFNVAFCTTAVNVAPSDNQAVLGTGVSGIVYFANVSKEGNDLFEKNQLDAESLIFPPHPQSDENTAGGVLKTRAKRSSRHPEYFAIGRGKSIHIIWPATALSPRYGISDTNRTVDVEKFYADRPLQILTGKAGKDFTFSEDDTMIVSLDKTGRLRFWDIRSLVDESNATAARVKPVVVDTPVLSLSTASPAEKLWPTSVTFVDKARPYRKGGALRYVLVGLRQNHTLQLWDIALGKAVQELNFPHENETDGICSVNYHPDSGIIVVSHPTRNSIFFIHLSAPRYSLSSQLSQASYVQRVAAKDPELPKPESTACMSGIREISFAEKGQLRSVELLTVHKSTEVAKDESASLFELYVVHSKGVTCLGINRADLGWNSDNKVLYPVDAQKDGLVTLKELKLGSLIEEPIRSKSPPKEIQHSNKNAKKKSKKTEPPAEGSMNGGDEAMTGESAATSADPTTILDKAQSEVVQSEIPSTRESKKAKKKAEKAEKAAQSIEQSAIASDANTLKPAPTGLSDGPAIRGEPAALSAAKGAEREPGPPAGEWLEKELENFKSAVSGEFRRELDLLYQNIHSDRAAQDTSSASRQEAILRLVSSSLSTNVEKSLSRITAEQIQQAVIPAVVQNASEQIASSISTTLREALPHQMNTHLSSAVNVALQNPVAVRAIADAVTLKLSKQLETQMTEILSRTMAPIFQNIATTAAEKTSADLEAQMSSQLRRLQLDRLADSENLEKVSNVLQGMAATLRTMSDSQVAFQAQILKERQAMTNTGSMGTVNTSRQVSTARGTPESSMITKAKSARVRSKADIELEEITNLMNEGRYEEGSIKWLQSAQPVKLFDELFVRFTPEYLATDVSPLVAFSVAVTVANSLNTNAERRLEWISAAFDAVDLNDPEIADLSQHAPALITSLVQKLESLYMTMSERNPADPALKIIPPLAKKGRDMKTAFLGMAVGPMGPALPRLTSGAFQ